MILSDILLILSIGLFSGVLAGMFGIGGGVVIVPALIAIMHFTQMQANGTSLAALMMPVGIFAAIAYYKKNLLDIRTSAIFAFGLLVGCYFGVMLALELPTQLLKQLYGIFLLWVCWRFFELGPFLKKKFFKSSISVNPESEKEKKVSLFILIPIGIFAGVLSGLFGIGGGLVIIPIMVTLMNFPPKKATGTSLGALLLPVAFPGVLAYYNAGHLDIPAAAILASGLIIGSIFGAKITIALPSPVVKKVYAVFLLVMALSFILS